LLLKSYEGSFDGSGEPVLTYYSKDGSKNGNFTFGWGHLVNSGPCHSKIRGKSITREEAESLFAGDLANHENNVRKHVGIKLYQNEFDALVILDFNYPLGSKSTPKLLRALHTLRTPRADFKGIIREWMNILGAPGLAARRIDELEVFFFGQYGRGKNR